MAEFVGDYSPPAGRIAIVAARFNALVTESLLRGCLDTLKRHGVTEDQVDIAWVPGSFEIPIVARKLAAGGHHAAVICLGCVIRGETPHFDHVASQAAAGIMHASLATGVPILFGVLTTDTVDQWVSNRASSFLTPAKRSAIGPIASPSST